MRILDDFVCAACDHRGEYLHEQGVNVMNCPACGAMDDFARVWPTLQHVENFGATGVHHTPCRRLSKAEDERRQWYRQTRHKEASPETTLPKTTFI